MVANIFFRSHFPSILQSPINAGAFTMLFGLVLVPVISWITPKPDQTLVQNCFACYDTDITVKTRASLGFEEK
jgi:hypothetical protein